MAAINYCPCGSLKSYADCCGRYLDGQQTASTAEALMRSRYTAYTLLRDDYLLATWHSSTRPAALNLAAEPPTQWLGLTVKDHQSIADQATVEFVARYRINGRAQRLQEVSRFTREADHWFYLDGECDVR